MKVASRHLKKVEIYVGLVNGETKSKPTDVTEFLTEFNKTRAPDNHMPFHVVSGYTCYIDPEEGPKTINRVVLSCLIPVPEPTGILWDYVVALGEKFGVDNILYHDGNHEAALVPYSVPEEDSAGEE